jgi:hypothetical protein
VTALLVFTRSLIGVTFLLSALSKVGSANGVRLFADTLVQLRLARPGRPAVAEHQAAPWPLWLILAPAGAACAFVISRLDDVVSLFKTA